MSGNFSLFHLLDSEKLRFLARSGAFRLQFESVDVVDGQNGGSHKPGQSQNGFDENQNGQDEQIQVVTASFLSRGLEKVELVANNFISI